MKIVKEAYQKMREEIEKNNIQINEKESINNTENIEDELYSKLDEDFLDPAYYFLPYNVCHRVHDASGYED